MTNDLNDHEQAHTYGAHLHVTLRGSFTCHLLGYAYMSLFERQGVRLPVLLEISLKIWCILSKLLLLQKTLKNGKYQTFQSNDNGQQYASKCSR